MSVFFLRCMLQRRIPLPNAVECVALYCLRAAAVLKIEYLQADAPAPPGRARSVVPSAALTEPSHRFDKNEQQ